MCTLEKDCSQVFQTMAVVPEEEQIKKFYCFITEGKGAYI